MEEDELEKTMGEAYDTSQWRDDQPYDGLLGTPPDWIPEYHLEEFIRVRNRTLNEPLYGRKVDHQNVIKWMDAYASMHGPRADGEYFHPDWWPPELGNELSYLNLLRNAVNAGEAEGLLLLAGADAAIGRSHRKAQSSKAKKPRNQTEHYSEISTKEIIKGIIKDPSNKNDLSAKTLWSNFYNKLDALGLAPREGTTPDGKLAIWYEGKRGKTRMTFRTFENNLSQNKNDTQ